MEVTSIERITAEAQAAANDGLPVDAPGVNRYPPDSYAHTLWRNEYYQQLGRNQTNRLNSELESA